MTTIPFLKLTSESHNQVHSHLMLDESKILKDNCLLIIEKVLNHIGSWSDLKDIWGSESQQILVISFMFKCEAQTFVTLYL